MLAGLVGKKECEHGGLEAGGLPMCRLGKKSVNCVGQLDLHGLLLPVGLWRSEDVLSAFAILESFFCCC